MLGLGLNSDHQVQITDPEAIVLPTEPNLIVCLQNFIILHIPFNTIRYLLQKP